MYYQPCSQPTQPDGDDLFERFVIVQMAKEPNTCRNVLLGQFLDGHGLPHFLLANSALCNSCERMTAISGSRVQEKTPSNPRLDTLFTAAYSQIQGAYKGRIQVSGSQHLRCAIQMLHLLLASWQRMHHAYLQRLSSSIRVFDGLQGLG
jgi:hypothetical protein